MKSQLEDQILDLIENHDGITRSDLQSIVAVIVDKAYKLGQNNAAAALGKLGGSSTSEAKKAAVRSNGKKGGRPKK